MQENDDVNALNLSFLLFCTHTHAALLLIIIRARRQQRSKNQEEEEVMQYGIYDIKECMKDIDKTY